MVITDSAGPVRCKKIFDIDQVKPMKIKREFPCQSMPPVIGFAAFGRNPIPKSSSAKYPEKSALVKKPLTTNNLPRIRVICVRRGCSNSCCFMRRLLRCTRMTKLTAEEESEATKPPRYRLGEHLRLAPAHPSLRQGHHRCAADVQADDW